MDCRRLRLKSLNAHISCYICKGYLVDATTVIDCLHTCMSTPPLVIQCRGQLSVREIYLKSLYVSVIMSKMEKRHFFLSLQKLSSQALRKREPQLPQMREPNPPKSPVPLRGPRQINAGFSVQISAQFARERDQAERRVLQSQGIALRRRFGHGRRPEWYVQLSIPANCAPSTGAQFVAVVHCQNVPLCLLFSYGRAEQRVSTRTRPR